MKEWKRAGQVASALGLVAGLSSPAFATGLREAVELAVRNHPEVLAATQRRLAADEQVAQARAGYLPQVEVSAGFGRERLNSMTTRSLGLSDPSFNQQARAVQVTQMLFDGMGTPKQVAQQRARSIASAEQLGAQVEETALKAVGAYLELLRRRETVDLAKQNIVAHLRIRNMIEKRVDAGVGRRSDLDQAEARVALAKANLRQERAAMLDAEATYLQVVGEAPGKLAPLEATPRATPPSEKEGWEQAFGRHPAVRSASAMVESTQAQLGVRQAAFSPRLDLELTAAKNRDAVRGITDDYAAMLRVRYNLSSGGADSARVREARHLIAEAQQSLNRVRRQVMENVSQSINGLHAAWDRVELLKDYAASANAARLAYAHQFAIGQRTLLDLLNAENEYFAAASSLASARYSEQFAHYRLQASTGQLLESLGIAMPAEALSGGLA